MWREDGEDLGPDDAPRALLDAVMGIMHRQRLLLYRAFQQEDIHPAQGPCLRVLAQRDEITQSELAHLMLLSRPSVTRLLQRMERGGLVWRRTDPDDQRLTRVGLTDAGRALRTRLDAVMDDYVEATLARFSENDRRHLARLLRAWRELADEALGATGPSDGPDADHCSSRGSSRGTTG